MAAGKILIVDGIATNRVVLKVKLDGPVRQYRGEGGY